MNRLSLKSRISILALTLLACASPLIVHAQAASTGTVSPYASEPDCPSSMVDGGTGTCTYSNGQTASCTRTPTGPTQTLTCKNPDNSTSVCDEAGNYGVTEEGTTQISCQVTTASGASAGSTSVSAGATAVTTSQTTSTGVTTTSTTNPVTTAVTAVAKAATSGIAQFLSTGAAAAVAGLCYMVLAFASILLYMFGTFFNWITVITIFQFGNFFGNTSGLLISWGVLRDIGNIILLFGFVYIGVMMILDLHSFDARKALPRLVIFAVLLNFSLFAAEAIIDTSNVLSANLFIQAGQSNAACTTNNAATCAHTGIADQVIQTVGLGNIFQPNISSMQSALTVLTNDPVHAMTVYLGMALFVTIAATVLLAASIMLAIRALILTFIMVTSPIGFAAMVLPQLKGFADRWWNLLLSQAFFAPVFLLLLYVGLIITKGISTAMVPTGSAATVFDALNTPGTSYGTVFIVFGLGIGFMVAALMSAKSIGAIGASFATDTAARATYGTLTRASNYGVNIAGGFARKRIQGSAFGDSALGKNLVTTVFRPMEKANLDLRRVGAGAILKAAGAGGGADVASHATFGDLQHTAHEVANNFKKSDREYESEITITKLEKEAHDSVNGALSNDNQRVLARMSVKQLEELHGIQEGVQALAQNLSPQQFENLMKSDKLSDSSKDTLRNNRFKSVSEALNTAATTNTPADIKAARTAVQSLSEKDIDQLSQSSEYAGLFSDTSFASFLTDDQFTKARGNQNISRAQKDSLQTARASRFEPANVAATLRDMTADAVAKLPDPVLSQPHVIAALSGAQLAGIDPTKIKDDTLKAIQARFRNRLNGADDDEVDAFFTIAGKPAYGGQPAVPGLNSFAGYRWNGYTI